MGLTSRRSVALTICLSAVCFALLMAGFSPLFAVVKPEYPPTSVAEKVYRHPNLYIGNVYVSANDLEPSLAARYQDDLNALGVSPDGAFLDVRGGRWGTLMPDVPLVPGDGVGNALSWEGSSAQAPAGADELGKAAWIALENYLRANQDSLNVDVSEIRQPVNIAVHDDGQLIQINARRAIDGIEVLDTYLTAVISHGNLILFGLRNWGDLNLATEPALTLDQGVGTLRQHLGSHHFLGYWQKPHLVIVPMAQGTSLVQLPVGQGYDYRLAWVISPDFSGEFGRFQGMIDAQTGEVLSFEDTASYVATTRQVMGGVLPITNDGMNPDGIEQAGWPMPFADVSFGSDTVFTDEGGNLLQCVDGNITSTLNGQYMRMQDNCGAISLSSTGDIDFGTSAGTNCTTPGFGGPGNTHASRSGFYEMNRIKEMARGQLPNNDWLDEKLIANMNIPLTCNANWTGTVNFYRSGGGCNNTGEIAGVYDHEWGHGMDNNDVNPTISSPGEGIADVYAALRLNTSCIGRNFRASNCGGYGDPCTMCSGVRDIDWGKRASGTPHTLAWIDANCGSGGGTPCGGSTHCEGAVYAETAWDLFNRDLRGAPYNMDLNTALEITTQMVYRGAGPVGRWYNCIGGTGTGDGCNADGGYLNFLAADDDNGSLADGTPRMGAINAAFARHGIACPTPAVADSGCVGGPTTAPVVVGTAVDRGARLTWGAVAGATKYAVYRTDGVFGCDFGKIKVGETTDLFFVDDGLQNGRDYFYSVAAIGPAASCIGPLSACDTVTPVAGGNLAPSAETSLTFLSGDADAFVDNCEQVEVSFDVTSIGTVTQNNVRIAAITPTNPLVTIDSVLPVPVAATLAPCAMASASFEFTAGGLTAGESVEFVVEVTSDELAAAGVTKSVTLRLPQAESNAQFFASKTFSFEASREEWVTVEGTFNRTNVGGGASGTTFYMASSNNLPDQCDHVVSPPLILSATSTLSLFNQFDIENDGGVGVWYDRANIGTVNLASGERSLVAPDGGRAYNAMGANGNCGTANQPGWADSMPTWAQSTFSATALGSVDKAGDVLQLDVRYGTDPLAHGFGFWFDQVTVSNVSMLVADGQSDSCLGNPAFFTDGFEIGNTSNWSTCTPTCP